MNLVSGQWLVARKLRKTNYLRNVGMGVLARSKDPVTRATKAVICSFGDYCLPQ
ncbi:hypothetical protein [Scytonema hofmannii]|uniref:hypothetical protein n=1 Tax=Scytonema hofmannii TaxID=34078 RepID=UPI00034690D4|nr:hypothetical protein [Scytonema hofmannii]